MEVHLVDGTYELFRYFFGQPSYLALDGREVGAVRGVLGSLLSMLESGVTHLGIATDHVVESFRNEMYAGYKTGEGIDETLFGQFPLLESSLVQLGFMVWPMVEYEADDGLASAAALAIQDSRVERIVICSPDKDLAQCVSGERVIVRNRRTEVDSDEGAIEKHFGVLPASIPDWLALVGDSADGFPGIKGWGKKSASTVLHFYGHLEDIPAEFHGWDEQLKRSVRGAAGLSAKLSADKDQALLFRDLATLRNDYPAFANIDELEWMGPCNDFEATCEYLGAPRLIERIHRLCPKTLE